MPYKSLDEALREAIKESRKLTPEEHLERGRRALGIDKRKFKVQAKTKRN